MSSEVQLAKGSLQTVRYKRFLTHLKHLAHLTRWSWINTHYSNLTLSYSLTLAVTLTHTRVYNSSSHSQTPLTAAHSQQFVSAFSAINEAETARDGGLIAGRPQTERMWLLCHYVNISHINALPTPGLLTHSPSPIVHKAYHFKLTFCILPPRFRFLLHTNDVVQWRRIQGR